MQLACTYSEEIETIDCATAVLVTERLRETALFDALRGRDWASTVDLIGDAAGPGLIADAVYSGHAAARNFERANDDIEADWARREIVSLVE